MEKHNLPKIKLHPILTHIKDISISFNIFFVLTFNRRKIGLLFIMDNLPRANLFRRLNNTTIQLRLFLILIMENKFDNMEKPRPDPIDQLHSNDKNIFDYISEKVIKYKNTSFYQFVYKHPMISVSILILWGVVIIGMFFYFILTLIKLS
jgi:hypothetical protein